MPKPRERMAGFQPLEGWGSHPEFAPPRPMSLDLTRRASVSPGAVRQACAWELGPVRVPVRGGGRPGSGSCGNNLIGTLRGRPCRESAAPPCPPTFVSRPCLIPRPFVSVCPWEPAQCNSSKADREGPWGARDQHPHFTLWEAKAQSDADWIPDPPCAVGPGGQQGQVRWGLHKSLWPQAGTERTGQPVPHPREGWQCGSRGPPSPFLSRPLVPAAGVPD